MSDQTYQKQISVKLAERENEFLSIEQMRIFCGTFNVNGKTPDEDLRPWLFINEKHVDVYAIGLQEVVDLNTTSYLLQSDWAEREQRWIDSIEAELCNNKEGFNNLKSFLTRNKKPINYKRVRKHRMFGLLILVYVGDHLYNKDITEVFSSEVPTGIMDTLGNKGSVGISLRLNETRICFVCSHFASDTDKLQKRNADFRSTKQRLKFEYNANMDYFDLDGHDVVFWFGDLNYRLDKISLNNTIDKIYSNEMNELIEFDQLTKEMRRLNVFDEYSEGKINFRPTYKYLVKEDIYEKQAAQKAAIQKNDLVKMSENDDSNVKVKLPSWTDRILWKSPNSKVNLIQYSCINTITISDHKPVYALFDANIKKIDEKKYNKIYDSLLKDSDRKINEEMPRISIDKHELKFTDCKFYDQKSLYLSVKNEGLTRSNVDVLFYDLNVEAEKSSIIDKDPSVKNSYPKSRQHNLNQWCTINPQHKERMDPGNSYRLEISTNFSQNTLLRFKNNSTIDDFLIVRCLNGNDIFVTIVCEYKPTIIGYSIKALTTIEDSDSCFDQSDPKEFYETHEGPIESFEKNLDSIWMHNLKNLSAESERKKAEKLFGDYSQQIKPVVDAKHSKSIKNKSKFYSETTQELSFGDAAQSKLDLYQKSLESLKEQIITDDAYFNNDLSSEYKFLMEHLIGRCNKNLEDLDSNNMKRNSSFSIEDQKNLVLSLLSSRDFVQFSEENFDMELLAEVLYDLLYALPTAIIPSRYLDIFMYIGDNYAASLKVFDYIPKSHTQLFEMLVKFLQVYSRCLSSCGSNLNSLIANAVFKINTAKLSNTFKEDDQVDKEFYKSQTANKFFKLFIDNHKSFVLI